MMQYRPKLTLSVEKKHWMSTFVFFVSEVEKPRLMVYTYLGVVA